MVSACSSLGLLICHVNNLAFPPASKLHLKEQAEKERNAENLKQSRGKVAKKEKLQEGTKEQSDLNRHGSSTDEVERKRAMQSCRRQIFSQIVDVVVQRRVSAPFRGEDSIFISR